MTRQETNDAHDLRALTSVRGVRVISRTSAFAFLGKDIEVTEIGRRLRVGTALEGSEINFQAKYLF